MPINSSFTELASATIEKRQRKFANNVENGNALLSEIQKAGNVMPASGGTTILQEVDIVENGTFMYYSGYETLDIAPSEVLSTSQWEWKQAAVVVSVSGLETDVINSGPERQIELLAARISNAERTMKNNISSGIYSDGTGSAGKQITGLQKIIQPVVAGSQTTTGGINPATYTNWANQQVDYGAATASTIQGFMNDLYLACTFGNESPNMIVMSNALYSLYWESLQAIQRITEEQSAGAGFRTLRYGGNIPVYYENAGITANYGYFLNTNYLHWRPHPARNMVSLGERKPINQDASVFPIVFAGNMTCSGRRYQGVLWT